MKRKLHFLRKFCGAFSKATSPVVPSDKSLTKPFPVCYTKHMKNQAKINRNPLPVSLLSAMTEPLAAWYLENQKPLPWRATGDPYHIWLSEVMLQQTRTAAVIPYYHRFIDALPTVKALAETDDEVLMKLWEGLGYYSRARNLKAAAIRIVEEHGGKLPEDFHALLALPGIGDYTAGAISSIAFGLPEPAVDGNVLRVIMRLCASELDIAAADTKKAVTDALRRVYPKGNAASVLTQAIMELGENICIPNGRPRCMECPLAPLCRGLADNRVDDLPHKSPKKARRIEQKTVLLLEHNGAFVIRRRPEKGLLASLWEFPCLDGHLTPNEALAWAREQGLSPVTCTPCDHAVHIFTHVEWHMTGYRIPLATAPKDHTLATSDQLVREYAVPKAFEAFKKIVSLGN